MEKNNYVCQRDDILNPRINEKFDIVYSWGVLHHTGDMWGAIKNAASFVDDEGKLIIAIYNKTPFCKFWTIEKKIYVSSPKIIQLLITSLYAAACFMRSALAWKNPVREIREYKINRGMDWMIDKIDWVGGYPYESATPEDIENFLNGMNFKLYKQNHKKPPFGLLGTGCAEYVFVK